MTKFILLFFILLFLGIILYVAPPLAVGIIIIVIIRNWIDRGGTLRIEEFSFKNIFGLSLIPMIFLFLFSRSCFGGYGDENFANNYVLWLYIYMIVLFLSIILLKYLCDRTWINRKIKDIYPTLSKLISFILIITRWILLLFYVVVVGSFILFPYFFRIFAMGLYGCGESTRCVFSSWSILVFLLYIFVSGIRSLVKIIFKKQNATVWLQIKSILPAFVLFILFLFLFISQWVYFSP